MNKYQITFYWSDSNTFPETISQETITRKNEDNVIEYIKAKIDDKTIVDQLEDIGTDTTVLSIDLAYDEKEDCELTIQEYETKYPNTDFSDEFNAPYVKSYNWEIVNLSEDLVN